jgi:ABC-type ATPase with predicted acetyltransferase domain
MKCKTEIILQDVAYWKCVGCGYEYLSNSKTPICPRCKSDKVEKMDVKKLVGFDE